MECSRLPGYYFDKIKTNNKPQYGISEQLPRELDEFRRQFLGNDPYIELGYADEGIILVTSKSSVAWTEKLHECFCEAFNVILNSVEKVETFEPRNYRLTMFYFYIPKFYNKKYDDEFSIDLPV